MLYGPSVPSQCVTVTVPNDARDRPRHDGASHGADAFRSLAMTYRDIKIEAKPEGPRDPLGRIIETAPRKWKYLSEMTYDEFIGTKDQERQRVRV